MKYKSLATRDDLMLTSIEIGWFIIDEYYKRSDEVPVYTAALLLDPLKRLTYIKKNWHPSWIKPAVAKATQI